MIKAPDFTLVDVKKATAALPKQGKKLLEQYRNNMRLINMYQVDDIGPAATFAKKSLDTLSEHLFADKKKRVPILKAVVDIVHTQVYNAMKALDGLQFYEVGEISNKVLKYAMERDDYIAQAEKIVNDARKAGLTELNKYQKQEYKRLMKYAEAYDNKRIEYAKSRLLALEYNRKIAEQAGKGAEYEFLYGLPD